MYDLVFTMNVEDRLGSKPLITRFLFLACVLPFPQCVLGGYWVLIKFLIFCLILIKNFRITGCIWIIFSKLKGLFIYHKVAPVTKQSISCEADFFAYHVFTPKWNTPDTWLEGKEQLNYKICRFFFYFFLALHIFVYFLF